jgi:hypothetical protein
MPNIVPAGATAYQQILSMALEDRSTGYQDLVSNNNALLAVTEERGSGGPTAAAHPADLADR